MPDTGEKDPTTKDLAEALKALVKLMKAIRYYPPGHPSLKNAVAQALGSFSALLSGQENLLLGVRKEGFFLDEAAVAPEDLLLQKLATFLFARRIHRLMVLPDLSARDLRALVRCLALTPREIQKHGGFQEVLLKARVSTLWVNEFDLAAILARKEEIEAERKSRSGGGAEEEEEELFFAGGEEEPGTPEGEQQHSAGAESSFERGLEEVLLDLEAAENEQDFRLLLQELVPLIRLNLTDSGRDPVLRAMDLLCGNASDPEHAPARRESAHKALTQLGSEDVLDFLVHTLCDRELAVDRRRRLVRVLLFLQDKALRRLMDRLTEERDPLSRKFLTEALVLQGPAATPILAEYLGDDRWYVVRNAVAILGDIRDREATAYLPALLRHSDIRVRRETIRALTKIGGPDVVDILLAVLEEEDQELGPQALLSLGAMKNPAAVPVLLRLVDRPDPWVKQVDIKKGALKALGEIGSVEALPALHQVLGRRKLWQRSRYDEIRASAALALGEIGSAESLALLEKAAEDRAEIVARAAVQSMKQIRKGTDGP